MAHIVMAYIGMAYIGMAYIGMAHIVMACIGMVDDVQLAYFGSVSAAGCSVSSLESEDDDDESLDEWPRSQKKNVLEIV